jgi:hypothetical protein
MLEVFTKAGVDSEKIRNLILEKVGVTPELYDNGTHYVTNQKKHRKNNRIRPFT